MATDEENPLAELIARISIELESPLLPPEKSVQEQQWPLILWWWAILVSVTILPVPALMFLQFMPPPFATERLSDSVLIAYATVSMGSGGLLGAVGVLILRPFDVLTRKE